MNPLREVIARFSVLVDDAPFKKLDRDIQKLESGWSAMGTAAVIGLAAATAASYRFIQAASNVTETQNKIEALFGASARKDIVAWSQTVEKEMGRSEFAFQRSFSDFAAFLDPMQLGLEKTVEFSKNLSKLTVDLASFYNTSEEDARMRLFSGVSGETEAVRRLGIDISDTSLTELYQSQENPLSPGNPGKGGTGVNRGKGLASLTLAEKTQLRIYKIMKDTKKVQGDAARTAQGWANTLKRLTDRFARLEVAIGKLLEGPGVKLLNWLEAVTNSAEDLAKNSSTLQAALALLAVGGIAKVTLATWDWVAANAALIASLLPIAVVIGGAFLVVEDFMTFLKGGESVFKHLVIWLEDIANPAKVVRDLFRDISVSLDQLNEGARNSWIPGVGAITRLKDKVVHGRDFMDDTTGGTDMRDMATRQREGAQNDFDARKVAVSKRDFKGFVENRSAHQTDEDVKSEWDSMSRSYLKENPTAANADDQRAYGISSYRAPETKVGSVTVSPTVHLTVHTKGELEIGQIEVQVKKVLKDSAATAAAALRRRGAPQAAPGK